MKQENLKRGDVVWLANGTNVGYANFPLCLHTETFSTFTQETASTVVKVGKQYHNRTDVSKEREAIREGVINVFQQHHAPLSLEILDRFLAHQIRDQPAFMLVIPSGHYVVTEVRIEKGMRIVDLEELYGQTPTKIHFWQDSWGPRAHNNIAPVGWVDLDEKRT